MDNARDASGKVEDDMWTVVERCTSNLRLPVRDSIVSIVYIGTEERIWKSIETNFIVEQKLFDYDINT